MEEAIRSGLRLSAVFFSESARERAHKLLPQLSSHTEALLLPDEVFASAVPSETPQGVAALVRVKSFGLDDVFAARAGVVGDHCRPAGSGKSGDDCAIGRSVWGHRLAAWRANREPVELEGGASFGGIVVSPADGEGRIGESAARDQGSRSARAGHVVASGHSIADADLRGPVAFIVGSEGAGVPKDVLAQADEVVAIPQSPRVESLNAGIAASIMLYEAARQRESETFHHGGHGEHGGRKNRIILFALD